MTPSARSRAWYGLPATAAAVVAVVALTGGMAWLGHRVSDAGPQVPRPAPGRSLDLTLTYVGTTPAGPRLFTEVHRVPDSRKSALTVAISALMTDSPRDDDYRNYLLASHMSAKATQEDGIVTINFAAPPRRTPDLDDAKARVVIQALVHTADDAVGSDAPVRFAVAGDPVDSVFGVDTTRPVEPLRGDGIDSPVSIESPADNAFLRSGSSVLGRASTADGRVYWAVYRTSGLVRVGHGASAPSRCCEFTPFTFRLPQLPRGSTYVLVVGSDADLGSGDTTVDTKEFSIR